MDNGLELRRAGGKGEGVFATRCFAHGETVMVGRIDRELHHNHPTLHKPASTVLCCTAQHTATVELRHLPGHGWACFGKGEGGSEIMLNNPADTVDSAIASLAAGRSASWIISHPSGV